MKRIYFKIYSRFLTLISSCLGLGITIGLNSCAPEYGPPADYYQNADYKVFGKITDKNDSGIGGIRIIMKDDTSFSDSSGKYEIIHNTRPRYDYFVVSYDDVDGIQNNKFHSKDTIISFENPDYKNGNGDYLGEASEEVDISLEEK